MTTEKQTEANQDNALLSTGAKTPEGKAVVSKNAVKHGIFTKELIIDGGDGKENKKEYEELLDNLMDYFKPNGQLETSLVEKIAVDFWRLKRLIRFETGSIRSQLDHAIEEYYSEKDWNDKTLRKSNEAIDRELPELKEQLDWEKKFLKCLEAKAVDLTKNKWENEEIEVDLSNEYFRAIESVESELEGLPSSYFEKGEMTVNQMTDALKRNGYDLEGIRNLFIKCCRFEIARLESEIDDKSSQKGKNRLREEVEKRLNVIPTDEAVDKILRYERSIEKSIFQKIIMLKNIQRPIT